MQASRRSLGRVLLVAVTLWALAMIVPDIYRLKQPLGSFGFYANNDGLITDVQGPFTNEATSPAWQAGLRPGDRLDLFQMRCIPLNTPRCATALAILGGLQLVSDHRRGELALSATADKPVRQIELVAVKRPVTWWVLAVLVLDQFAAILVILAAAWLVWTRPGAMTWGFFLYVVWFNPGQSYQYYALLQHSPAGLLTQNLAGAVAQGVGYAGFLLFALRAPQDQNLPHWRRVERALPAVGFLLAILLAISYANILGYPTETITRAGILSGFLVAASAFAILLARRKELPPSEYQRLRWVIWGCLIGLPALILADIGQGTTLLTDIWGNMAPSEEAWGLIRLVNGVLCLFVFEAVRRPRVVNVAIPLRRVTILGLLLSVPTLLLHEQIDHLREGISESLTLPSWVWYAIAAVVLFIISRLHEFAVHHADRYFHRAVASAGRDLGKRILRAQDFVAIEDPLVRGASEALRLSSASIFRDVGGAFRRGICEGWDGQRTETLDPNDAMLKGVQTMRPFDVDVDDAERNHLPDGLTRPVLAVPVGNRFHCYAVVLYGAHACGTELDSDERAMLAELAELAASVFAKLDLDLLRQRIAALERELDAMTPRVEGTRVVSGKI
jgi:hypothetical protein